MSSMGDPRAIMRSLPTQLQMWHASVFLWVALRVWCLRYPGSYQKLVLALVGIGILVVIGTMIADTSIFQRVLIPTRWGGERREGINLAAVSMTFMVLACLVLVATAMMAASMNTIPPPELFAALLVATFIGVLVTAVGSVLLSLSAEYPARLVPARGFLTQTVLTAALGALAASVLWPLTVVVERSLTPTILGSVAVATIGTGLVLTWILAAWRPWHEEYEDWDQ